MYRILAFIGVSLVSALAACQYAGPGGDRPPSLAVTECPTNGNACKCDTHRCRILVDVSSCDRGTPGTAKVLSGPITVEKSNKHARIIWRVSPAGGANPWVFRQGSGVVLKSTSADPSGQFYEKAAANASDDPDPTLRASKRYHWRDVNTTPAGLGKDFEYMVTLYDDDTNPNARKCVADPQIFNDG